MDKTTRGLACYLAVLLTCGVLLACMGDLPEDTLAIELARAVAIVRGEHDNGLPDTP